MTEETPVRKRRPKGWVPSGPYTGKKRGRKPANNRAMRFEKIAKGIVEEDVMKLIEPKKKVDLKKFALDARVYLFEDEEYEELAEELLAWLNENPEQRKLTNFLTQNRISYDDFITFTRKNEILGKAWNFAKMTIGSRREEDAYTGKANASTVIYSLGHYCPMVKEWIKEKHEMTQPKSVDEKSRIVYVEATKIEESSLVKRLAFGSEND